MNTPDVNSGASTLEGDFSVVSTEPALPDISIETISFPLDLLRSMLTGSGFPDIFIEAVVGTLGCEALQLLPKNHERYGRELNVVIANISNMLLRASFTDEPMFTYGFNSQMVFNILSDTKKDMSNPFITGINWFSTFTRYGSEPLYDFAYYCIDNRGVTQPHEYYK